MPIDTNAARRLLGLWAAAPGLLEQLQAERKWSGERLCEARGAGGCPAETDALCAHCEAVGAEIARLTGVMTAVDGLLAELPPHVREVVRLRYRGQMPYERIAVRLSYSVDRVRHLKCDADRFIAERIRADTV